MGLFDGVKSAVAGAVNTFSKAGGFGQIGRGVDMGAGGSGEFGMAMGGQLDDAIQGSKSPRERGKEAGEAQAAFMDAAYPGTNPWERLGTGQGGATAGSVTPQQTEMQERIADKTLSTQRQNVATQAYASMAGKMMDNYPASGPSLIARLAGFGEPDRGHQDRFAFEKDARSFALELQRAGVNVQRFNAVTQAQSVQNAVNRLDYDATVKAIDMHFKDRELSQDFAKILIARAETEGSTFWRSLRTKASEYRDDIYGLADWLMDVPRERGSTTEKMRSHTEAIRKGTYGQYQNRPIAPGVTSAKRGKIPQLPPESFRRWRMR